MATCKMKATESTFIQLTLSRTLLARADEAAAADGLSRPEWIRRAILSACERTEGMAARRRREALAREGRS